MFDLNEAHFVWMGREISGDHFQNIIDVSKTRDFFDTVYLWTDKPGLVARRLLEKQKEQTDGKDLKVRICDVYYLMSYSNLKAALKPVSEFLLNLEAYKTKFQNDSAKAFADVYIVLYILLVKNTTLVNPKDKPIMAQINFALASDVFRLILLYLYGGIYIDCDNQLLPANTITERLRKRKSSMKLDEDTIYLHKDFGNSCIASAPKNPAITYLLARMYYFYTSQTENCSSEKFINERIEELVKKINESEEVISRSKTYLEKSERGEVPFDKSQIGARKQLISTNENSVKELTKVLKEWRRMKMMRELWSELGIPFNDRTLQRWFSGGVGDYNKENVEDLQFNPKIRWTMDSGPNLTKELTQETKWEIENLRFRYEDLRNLSIAICLSVGTDHDWFMEKEDRKGDGKKKTT